MPDITQLDQHKNELQGDVYFNCLGTTIKKAGSEANFRQVDYRGVVDFALIAKESNARKFVHISAMGANSKSRIFYNQVKGEVENALMAMNLNSLTILRPALLLSERSEERPMEHFAIKTVRVLEKILPPKLIKKVGTDADHLAYRMLEEGKRDADPVLLLEASEI